MLAHQGDEIMLSMPRQSRAREMGIGAEKAGGVAGVQIGEIAAPAAGDQDLRAGLAIVLDHQHAPPAGAGVHRRIKPCGARADDDAIEAHFRSNCTQAPFWA